MRSPATDSVTCGFPKKDRLSGHTVFMSRGSASVADWDDLADLGGGGFGVAAIVEPGDGYQVSLAARDFEREIGISQNRFSPVGFHDDATVAADDEFADIVRWHFDYRFVSATGSKA